MVCCFAPGCNHKSSDGRCSFFRFPTDVVQWRLWVRAIRRADRKPSTHSRVCSCHFPSGDRKVPVLFVATNVVPIGQNSEDHSYCLSSSKRSLSSSVRPATPGSRPRLRDRLRARARFSGMSWLLSPEQEDKIKEEPYSLATLSVPKIVESVGHQGPEAILTSMALSEKQQRVIQVETTGQRTNPNWHLFRRGRLTASNFGAVLKSKRVTAPLLARVLGQQQALDSVLSVQWGTVNESQGIRAFTTATQMPVQESGWWLSPSGLLGASPDGLVGSSAVLEVKCPYGAREMTITEALQIKGFCVSKEGGSYSLREDHPYWHQVQGQLHLTARQTCYFVVWTTKDSVVIPIARDDNWQSNLLALEDFFKAHMLPKLTLQ